MTTVGKRIYKATGYCRPAGVLVSRSDEHSVWLPVERPVRSRVRVIVLGDDEPSIWQAGNAQEEVVQHAREIFQRCGFTHNLRVHVDVLSAVGAYNGIRVARAEALATVRAVARALEEQLSDEKITACESIGVDKTGLLTGKLTLGGQQVRTLEVPRYTWLYVRQHSEGDLNASFGDPERAFENFPHVAREDSQLTELLARACSDHHLTPVAIVGGHTDNEPAAALMDWDTMGSADLKAAVNFLRKNLSDTHLAGLARSAVASE